MKSFRILYAFFPIALFGLCGVATIAGCGDGGSATKQDAGLSADGKKDGVSQAPDGGLVADGASEEPSTNLDAGTNLPDGPVSTTDGAGGNDLVAANNDGGQDKTSGTSLDTPSSNDSNSATVDDANTSPDLPIQLDNAVVTSNVDASTETSAGTSASGIAAMGSPIVGAAVILKDSAGHSTSATTATDGTYTLSTTGFTPPFLVQVQASSGNLYSVSADALNTTVINVDPYTDLIVRSWYSAQRVSIDTAFATPASNPAPAVSSVQMLHNAVANLLQMWLTNVGIDTSKFNLISTPFTANGAGFDLVLNESTVNASTGKATITAGGTTQISTITYDTTASAMTFATTTTNSSGTSQSTNTIVVPTQSPQQTALDSISATLAGLFNAINTNGSQLTAAELMPFLAPDLLDSGLNQTQYAAMLATELRGAMLPSVQIQSVGSLDLVNGIAHIVTYLNSNLISGSPVPTADFWFENVGGTWLIGGDKRIARVGVEVANRKHQGTLSGGGSGGSGVAIAGTVRAPDGTLTGVTITDASGVTGWNATPMQMAGIMVSAFQPTPTTTLEVDLRKFDTGWTDLGSTIIPVGTKFTIAVTPASGPVVNYTLASNASTTESISITSPTSGSLADYTLDQPQTVTWELPTTFAIAGLYLGAETWTTLPMASNASTYQCEIAGQTIAPTGAGFPTSGTITIPSTCHNQRVVFVEIEVNVAGINGESDSPTVNID